MPNEKIIEQLRSLIDEAKTHFTDDGDGLMQRCKERYGIDLEKEVKVDRHKKKG